MAETEQSTELADLRETARTVARELRNDALAWRAACAVTAATVVLLVLAIARPVFYPGVAAVVGAAVAGALWSLVAWRRFDPMNELRASTRTWRVEHALAQLEAFRTATVTFTTDPSGDDATRIFRTTGDDLRVELTAVQREVLERRALEYARSTDDPHHAPTPAEVMRVELVVLESACASAKVRLALLEESYGARDEALATWHRTAKAEIDDELRVARGRVAELHRRAEPNALGYSEASQVPTSDIGVSSASIERAVTEGMLDARNRRVAVQPALMHSSLSERARWSVQSPNVGLTRELLELFEPISREGPASDDAPSPTDPVAPPKPPEGA